MSKLNTPVMINTYAGISSDPFRSQLRMPAFTATFNEFLASSWPQFVHIRDCYLFQDVDYGRLFQMIDLTQNSLSSIETQLNKRSLIELLPGNAPNKPKELIEIGRQIQKMWATKLTKDYPGERFSVVFTEGDIGDDIENFELTFFKIRW